MPLMTLSGIGSAGFVVLEQLLSAAAVVEMQTAFYKGQAPARLETRAIESRSPAPFSSTREYLP